MGLRTKFSERAHLGSQGGKRQSYLTGSTVSEEVGIIHSLNRVSWEVTRCLNMGITLRAIHLLGADNVDADFFTISC